jgi:hypothetical protein
MKENDPTLYKLTQLQYFINESAQVCMQLAQLHKKDAQQVFLVQIYIRVHPNSERMHPAG